MEMRSRRKMLLFPGVPDATDEFTLETLISVTNKHIRTLGLQPEQINRAHRIGRSSLQKPRLILVKFCSVQVRDETWFAKTSIKSTGITTLEFLTKRQHRVFVAAREKLGIVKCWTNSGRIVALCADGRRLSISSLDHLGQIPTAGHALGLDLNRDKPICGGKVATNSASGSKPTAERESAKK